MKNSNSNGIPKRICIYPKDIQRITGRSLKTCREMLRDIRIFFKKEKKDLVTIYEFCVYTKFDIAVVEKFIE